MDNIEQNINGNNNLQIGVNNGDIIIRNDKGGVLYFCK